MASTLDRLAAGKYLSLTTYRRDGTAVATPVWLVREGEALLVVTESDSGKAKRLRSDDRVMVAPCDMRGRLTGDPVPGTAELLGADETARAATLIARRYGLMGRLFMWRSRHAERVAIRVRPVP